MNLQQMMIQAQKVQRELRKAQEEMHNKEFVVSKNGLVTVTVFGNKEIKSIVIEKDALEPDNKEIIEETIKSCINEVFKNIDEAEEEINEKITGSRTGAGF